MSFSKKKININNSKVSIDCILGELLASKLKKKFSHIAFEDLECAVEETIKFLYISSLNPSETFMVGNQLVDEIWHTLIVETSEYITICDRIAKGLFLHHSGILYEDYCNNHGPEKIHNEQLSWLATYSELYGDISEKAEKHLPLISALKNRLGLNLNDLNRFGRGLRLLLIATGGTALKKKSLAITLYKESVFIDLVLQPIEVKNLKYAHAVFN